MIDITTMQQEVLFTTPPIGAIGFPYGPLSPDGQKILFHSEGRLTMLNLNTLQFTPLDTPVNSIRYVWNPNSQALLVSPARGSGIGHVIRVDRPNEPIPVVLVPEYRLSSRVRIAGSSPDGRYLLLDGGPWIYDIANHHWE